MVRTRSRLGNNNGNRHPEPHVVDHAPKAVPTPKPITMEVVQEMIRDMMEDQREEMRHLIQENGREPTVSIMQLELNGEPSEEGNYSIMVSHVEPPRVRRRNPEERIRRNDCKYKDFMVAKQPSLSGSLTPIEVIDWISRMEMVFESCNYSNRKKTILVVRELKRII